MGRREPVPHQRHRGALALAARSRSADRASALRRGPPRSDPARRSSSGGFAPAAAGRLRVERVRVGVVRDGRAVGEAAHDTARGIGLVFPERIGREQRDREQRGSPSAEALASHWLRNVPTRSRPRARPARPMIRRPEDTRPTRPARAGRGASQTPANARSGGRARLNANPAAGGQRAGGRGERYFSRATRPSDRKATSERRGRAT